MLKIFTNYPILSKKNNGPIMLDVLGDSYKKIKTEKCILTTTSPNNCCVCVDGSILVVENILKNNRNVSMVCRKFLHVNDLFYTPLSSNNIGVFLCSQLSNYLHISLNDVLCKTIMLPVSNEKGCVQYSIFKILHLLLFKNYNYIILMKKQNVLFNNLIYRN